jgi:SAM-dependent methyltransferase
MSEIIEEHRVKQEVRQFYDQVGWQLVSDDIYQNARYEDLRPVARDYIHNCHMRIVRHLKPTGRYLLDAGSGPIQYPEYLEYGRSYPYRVCADISITALKEARKRIGERGLYVVADIANLPFKPDVFDGVVSLHTIHHLPEEEHLQAYRELHRVLAPNSVAAVVNGWPSSALMNAFNPLIKAANRLRHLLDRRKSHQIDEGQNVVSNGIEPHLSETSASSETAPCPNSTGKHQRKKYNPSAAADFVDQEGRLKGTFTNRHDVAWIKNEVGAYMPVEIRVWRSVSVRFLRALIHPKLGGRILLRLLFWLEEHFPHFFGENGKYPLIVLCKEQ